MLLNDLKYACRLLSKDPGFTVLTTLVMAAGIGLSVYLLTFINTVAFRDLPFEDGGSLVRLTASQDGEMVGTGINFYDYSEIKNNLNGLSEFSAYRTIDLNLSFQDGARRFSAVSAEPNIFQVTRVKPMLGRGFINADNQVGAKNVAVIGFDIWKNQFSSHPDILNEMVRINGESYQVIGVMPEGYFFPSRAEVWLPLRFNTMQVSRDEVGHVQAFAHIKEGFELNEINRELAVMMLRFEEKYPKSNTGKSAHIAPPLMAGAGDSAAVLYSMYVVACLILILASINVGNLLLSRAIQRSKETAVRMALGAPRFRLISQMLWESFIICSIGGVIGLLLVDWALELTQISTQTFFDDGPPFWFDFGIDGYAIKLFSIFVLASILVTGLLPAWKNSAGDFNSILRDGTRGAVGKRVGRLNQLLVISEIFISITVMIAAAVVVLGTYMAVRSDYGASTENILTAKVLLPDTEYDTENKIIQFVDTFQSRLERSVGIGEVMISTALPGEYTNRPTIAVKGKEYDQNGNISYPKANYILVAPGTLDKLDIKLIEGRYFNNGDSVSAETLKEKKSVIVTDSFVLRHFPNESALGKQLRIVEPGEAGLDWLTIVGIVEHTIQGEAVFGGSIAKLPSVFRPFSQAPSRNITIAIKMRSNNSIAVRTLRKVLNSIDPELPAFRIESYQQKISRNSDPSIFITVIFLVFAIVAAVLASTGIYGVMSNTVSQRTQEIGVKRALGAWDQRIIREFMIKGFKQLLWGGIPGLVAGSALGLGMSAVMGASYQDLMLIAITIMIVISSVVILATYLPTKRALKIEPSVALHYE